MDKNKGAAIVTGASSGIGTAIAKELTDLGYKVYGFGRDFSKCDLKSDRFYPVVCDLRDTDKLTEKIRKIDANKETEILVNNAGVGYYGLCEEINSRKISEMVRVNLEVPMILSSILLRTLKKNKGCIVNISSVTAQMSSPHGCVYGATKAGLSSFSASLFDEARKYGVRVVSIQPDMTDTMLYRNADFTADEDIMARLSPLEVADAVKYIITRRDGLAITSMTLKPQLHRIRRNK